MLEKFVAEVFGTGTLILLGDGVVAGVLLTRSKAQNSGWIVITFGWVGSALIGLAFVVVILRWFASGGINGGRRFICLIWLALAGCLAHARFDFPFQIYSIVLLFLVLCAMLFTLSKR